MNSSDANNTLIDEMMQLLIAEKEKAFPTILAKLYNQAMIVERETHLGAGSYERSEGRDGYANGFKPRNYQTFHGNLELQVPQVRGSSTKFYPKCLDRGSRSERAIALAAAQMYLQGVSTRRGETVFQCMGIEHYSAEQVSNAAKMLDEELGNWRKRRLGCIKVLFVDATYQKVRVDGAAMDLATFIVTGISEDGHRSIIAVDSAFDEAESHWRNVFRDLVERGIHGVKWQRCQLHLQQNAQAQISKTSLKGQVASDIRAIFNAPSYEEAKRLLDRFVAKYAKEQPKLSAWAEETIPEGLTVFSLPEPMRKKLRTNNLEERLNRSIKARTRLIRIFPNQASQLRLVSAICMKISDEWEAGMIYLNV